MAKRRTTKHSIPYAIIKADMKFQKKINQKGRQGSRTAKNTAYISLLVLHGVSTVILEIDPYMDRLSLIIGSCIVIYLTYTT